MTTVEEHIGLRAPIDQRVYEAKYRGLNNENRVPLKGPCKGLL